VTTTPTPTTPASITLADLVDHQPHAARVLERHGLDYCCGGARPLDAACAPLGIDPAAVLAEVDAAAPDDGATAGAWTTMGAAELVDHLEATHHRYLHEELPRLEALCDRVVGVHGSRHLELDRVAATFGELRADLEPHLAKEERVLFPMIRELAAADGPTDFHCGSLQDPISVMLAEHDRAGALLATLRDLTGGYQPPDDACGSYRALYAGLEALEADTHLHVHKENNVLFPLVVALEGERSPQPRV
jgi:regulator of cell morphogenesis and NO signaling